MNDETPLHEMNATSRFSDRVRDYISSRPSYPSGAIDAILDGLGDPCTLLAADIGAGTGISARLLADRGVQVRAVEPNAEMRAGAECHPRVEFSEGTGERTGLGDGCVRLVVAAQAFHWLRAGPALAEFRRILKLGGRAALMWNDRDARDPMTVEYTRILREASGFSRAAEDRSASGEAILASPYFTGGRLLEFRNEQRLDRAGLMGRAMSASYCPKEGPLHAKLMDELAGLHSSFADQTGHVSLVYATRVYLAEAA